eukprot:1142961-Pelagomonas_calceolata.AAC.1
MESVRQAQGALGWSKEMDAEMISDLTRKAGPHKPTVATDSETLSLAVSSAECRANMPTFI